MPDQTDNCSECALDALLILREFALRDEALILGVDQVIKDFEFRSLRYSCKAREFLVPEPSEPLSDVSRRRSRCVFELITELELEPHCRPLEQLVDPYFQLASTLPRDDLAKVLPSTHVTVGARFRPTTTTPVRAESGPVSQDGIAEYAIERPAQLALSEPWNPGTLELWNPWGNLSYASFVYRKEADGQGTRRPPARHPRHAGAESAPAAADAWLGHHRTH